MRATAYLLSLAALAVVVSAALPIAAAQNTTADRTSLPVLSKPAGGAGAAASVGAKSVNGPSTYWYDGQRKRALRTDPQRIADFGSAPAPRSRPELRSVDKTPSKEANGRQSPLFIDAASGRLTGALPGGIVVQTLAPIDTEQATRLASRFGAALRTPVGEPASGARGEAGARYRQWVFDAPAGVASLELANTIHESGAVAAAAPDWWKPRALK